MARLPLEVADIIAAHGDAFLNAYAGAVSSAKIRVLFDLASCRTAALGGHAERCGDCGNERLIAYNSCGNRHCPKCQGAARAEWVEAREAELLPVRYFHVVFTIPAQMAQIARQNKKVMYDILFRASAQALLQIAGDPKHLGAKIGFLSVLHTWGQSLMHHPHVHCVVPGGGLSLDGKRWISSRPDFFLSVRVLGILFRAKFMAMTRRAFAQDKLVFQGELSNLNDPAAFTSQLKTCYDNDWVVYSKRPFGGPKQVLKYLGRYTHRVAISNHRLLSLSNGTVSFHLKDYADDNRQKTMTLNAVEFLRRFLLHVLPRGFMRIRSYGLLANTHRRAKIKLCRVLLGVRDESPESPLETQTGDTHGQTEGEKPRVCPICGSRRLTSLKLPRQPLLSLSARAPPILETA